jgi:hypothetical protein
MQTIKDTAEEIRLQESRNKNIPWKKWGPYLSERQWGTVREDYSESRKYSSQAERQCSQGKSQKPR